MFRLLPAIFLSATLLLSDARSELLITVDNGSIAPGASVMTFEVGIESTTPPNPLSDFLLILEITPLQASGDSSLRFVNPQSEAFLSDADYVFAGTSEVIALNESSVFTVTADELVLEDLSVVGLDIANVSVTDRKLLATFDVSHVLGSTDALATLGDRYEVSVSSASDLGQANGDFVDFSSVAGIITVEAVAIPEPGFAGLLALGGGLVCLRRRRPASASC